MKILCKFNCKYDLNVSVTVSVVYKDGGTDQQNDLLLTKF